MKWIKPLYFNNRAFQAAGIIVFLAILGYSVDFFETIARLLIFGLLALLVIDIILLFRVKKGMKAERFAPEKFSNGDENPIKLSVQNFYQFEVNLTIIDEVPAQFQMREANFKVKLDSGGSQVINYTLRPVKRGEYHFGKLNILTQSPIGLISRRFQFAEPVMVPVYPSFIQMRKYELLAISNDLTMQGIKKIRRLGHNQEFEQIKEYVAGDDFRTVNWKATARKAQLMVNTYQDEKSQQVYSLIDKSRVMKMPFEGMSLLDYAINATLALSNIAIKKGDKAGLISFQNKVNTVLPASKRNKQMQLIQESLYNQKTAFKEADFSRLFVAVKRKLTQRSLLMLYTNFESMAGLERQLPLLRKLSKSHVLVVIFFQNTELTDLLESRPKAVKDIYYKTIAEKYDHEKRLIVRELRKHGIYSVLTTPKDLTINTINKYLELKARGLI
ncbi:MAG: DUF58 domain-containing protein [Cytophagales bacterium CG17_big_fil_post_rev_8_21_14_2_50_40_13]|nr:MAG: DUF58 domain-containing protein [Cytophagales bacterium CG17_big_fil_post_rev_8_21_14_2_50_40_13]